MRKFLTTGLFSAILGLTVGAPADAALVSRGFLDEALENYATTTALDLKANQSDFTDLSSKIGELPSGDMHALKGLMLLLPDPEYYTYPTTIGDSIFQLYSGTLGLSGLAEAVYYGNESMGQTDPARQVKGLRQITDEIGTLPSGNFPRFPGDEFLFPDLNQPLTYPTSLAELITAIYGNSETGGPGLLAAIITGFPTDSDGNGSPDKIVGIIPNFNLVTDALVFATENATKIGTVPDGKNLAGMISETDAKIGDLPTEYETVGAALTAIKGIAEDAKATALSAIPDPKTEGSTGKFVLTVDIVGDNATYRWEKIDREGEATTTE